MLRGVFGHGASEERAEEVLLGFVVNELGQSTFFGVEGDHRFDEINIDPLLQQKRAPFFIHLGFAPVHATFATRLEIEPAIKAMQGVDVGTQLAIVLGARV